MGRSCTARGRAPGLTGGSLSMASFNDNRRGEGPKRRHDDPRRRRSERPGDGAAGESPAPDRRQRPGVPTSTNLGDAQNGPMANLGPAAVDIYSEYQSYVAAGAKGTFTSPQSKDVYVYGTDVGIDVRGYGNFKTFEQSMVSLGMVVTATTPSIDLVEGFVPIAKLAPGRRERRRRSAARRSSSPRTIRRASRRTRPTSP